MLNRAHNIRQQDPPNPKVRRFPFPVLERRSKAVHRPSTNIPADIPHGAQCCRQQQHARAQCLPYHEPGPVVAERRRPLLDHAAADGDVFLDEVGDAGLRWMLGRQVHGDVEEWAVDALADFGVAGLQVEGELCGCEAVGWEGYWGGEVVLPVVGLCQR